MFKVGDKVRYRENLVTGTVVEVVETYHVGEIVIWQTEEGHTGYHTPENLDILEAVLI